MFNKLSKRTKSIKLSFQEQRTYNVKATNQICINENIEILGGVSRRSI